MAGLKVKAKHVTRAVKLMTDPQPRFVSLVQHAATQTPFRSIKSAIPLDANVCAEEEDTDMAGDATPSVRSITFKKAYYATPEVVKKWLDDGGWDGFTITEKSSYFIVEGDDTSDDMFDELKTIKMDNGIVANVGKLKDDADNKLTQDQTKKSSKSKTEPVTKRAVSNIKPAPKATTKATDADVVAKWVSENTKKWSYWDVYSSPELDFNAVIADAMADGIPPGTGEVFEAMRVSLGNTLKTDALNNSQKRDALNLIGTQFTGIVYSMYEVFDTIAGADEATTKTIKTEKPKLLEWMNHMANVIKASDDKTLVQKMNTYGDNQGKLTPKTPESGEGSNPNADDGALVGDTDKDKIKLDPAHGKGVDATTAEGLTGTDTAAVKSGDDDEPEEVTQARAVLAAYDPKKPKVKPKPGQPDVGMKSESFDPAKFSKMVAEAVGVEVQKHITPISEKLTELEGSVIATKAETDALSRRAPTKKGATSGGNEEQVEIGSEAAKKAAEEAAAAKKYSERLRRDHLGLI